MRARSCEALGGAVRWVDAAHRELDEQCAEAEARDQRQRAPLGSPGVAMATATTMTSAGGWMHVASMAVAASGLVPLVELVERTARTGSAYLVGFVGCTKLLGFPGVDRMGNRTWRLFARPDPEPVPGERPRRYRRP